MAPAIGVRIDRDALNGDDRDWLFRATLDALAARPEPTIMVGEDAHWADGATLELVRFLARRIDDVRVLVVVTYRDDEVGPRHPLRLLLGDLATASNVHRLHVDPLSAAAVMHLAEGSGRNGAALHHLTGGNPFFVSEVLATAGDSIPVTVEDAVLARAARLSPNARAMLEVAAVIATTIYPDLLAAVAGPDVDYFDECLERGLLRAMGHDLAFRHELTRKAIMAAISPPRRRLLHAKVLAALQARASHTDDLALLAHHAEGALDREAVLRYAVAAAEQASALHAYREAAAQYARALRFAEQLPLEEQARLLEAQSEACYLSDQADEALSARQAALDMWRTLGNRLKEGENLRWLSRVAWIAGARDAAEAAGAAAVEVLQAEPPGPELAMAYSNLAQLRMLGNDLEGTLQWGQQAIDVAERLGEEETLVHALANVGTARQASGDDAGEEALQRSLDLAMAGGYPDHACRALTNLAWGSLCAMRLPEAEQRLATAIGYATEHDLDSYLRYLLATRCLLRVRQGNWQAAEREIRQLLQVTTLSTNVRIVAMTAWGLALTRQGRLDAEKTLDDALKLANPTEELMRLHPVRAARAEAAILSGDRELAAQEANALRTLTFNRGDRWQRGELAWLLWQTGDRSVPMADLAAPYALQIAGDFPAAAAAWHEAGCPYEAALAQTLTDDPAQIQQAVVTFEQLGARPALALAIERLRTHGVDSLPVVRRGPRASTRANPAGLTKREAEVLGLVVTGLRNAEIAQRLYLTPKTVGHHISAIYTKLGVSNRAEAVSAAMKLGVPIP
jgi:DNA-binding CsgD family transcriptional regulator